MGLRSISEPETGLRARRLVALVKGFGKEVNRLLPWSEKLSVPTQRWVSSNGSKNALFLVGKGLLRLDLSRR